MCVPEAREAAEDPGDRVLADAARRESSAPPGWSRAFQKPAGKPSATVFTLVEPRRSAAATRRAPPLACCRWWSARPSSPRRVAERTRARARSSAGVASGAGALRRASVVDRRRGAGRRVAGPLPRRRAGRGRPRGAPASDAAIGGSRSSTCERMTPSAVQKHSSRTPGRPRRRSAGRPPRAGRQRRLGAGGAGELRERCVEARGAELVAGAVARPFPRCRTPALDRRDRRSPWAGRCPGRSARRWAARTCWKSWPSGTSITFQSCR